MILLDCEPRLQFSTFVCVKISVLYVVQFRPSVKKYSNPSLWSVYLWGKKLNCGPVSMFINFQFQKKSLPRNVKIGYSEYLYWLLLC